MGWTWRFFRPAWLVVDCPGCSALVDPDAPVVDPWAAEVDPCGDEVDPPEAKVDPWVSPPGLTVVRPGTPDEVFEQDAGFESLVGYWQAVPKM